MLTPDVLHWGGREGEVGARAEPGRHRGVEPGGAERSKGGRSPCYTLVLKILKNIVI